MQASSLPLPSKPIMLPFGGPWAHQKTLSDRKYPWPLQRRTGMACAFGGVRKNIPFISCALAKGSYLCHPDPPQGRGRPGRGRGRKRKEKKYFPSFACLSEKVSYLCAPFRGKRGRQGAAGVWHGMCYTPGPPDGGGEKKQKKVLEIRTRPRTFALPVREGPGG
ncbi:hypothetical protein BH24BAC1_BH24BAC1_25250 [soil metagenome]